MLLRREVHQRRREKQNTPCGKGERGAGEVAEDGKTADDIESGLE